MKKKALSVLVLTLVLSMLAGCAVAPSEAADGGSWSEEWITLGPVLGVEPPKHGLVLLDNNTALTANDLYYAAWTIGDTEPYTNADGEEVSLYDAQLDILAYGCTDAEHALETVEDWKSRQDRTYTGIDRQEASHNGQDYTIASYKCVSETNPYSRGVSAFGVCGKYAVSMELNCRDSFGRDEVEILSDFLDGCHYGADIAG